MKGFYTYYVNLDLFHSEFDRLDLEEKEREEILNILEEIYVHKLIDRVLEELSDEKEKKMFLQILSAQAEIEMIQFLKERIENIEEKLKTEVKTLTEELVLEIKELA